MLESFLPLRKFLSGQFCELFGAGLACGQQCRQYVVSFFRHDIPMGLGHFHNQAVGSQQSQAPSHRRHLLTLFSPILTGRVKMSPNIAVTKAIERKFSTVDDGHHLSITIPQRIERSVALTLVPHRPTHPGRLFLKRGLYMDRSQSRQMPLGGRPTHLGTPIKVGHASAQDPPLLGTAGVLLRSTKAAKLSGFVNRCFHTQHAPLVVELKRVLVHPVLDPHPIAATASVGHHLIANPDSSRTPPKSKHLFGAKTHHRVMHQRGINPLKRFSIPKHHVGSVFGLGRRPVIFLPDGSADLGMERMTPLDQGTQKLAPLALMLLIHQRLGTPDISHPRIAVLLSSVAHPGSVHLTPEPLSPVQTHLNEKRKPALQSKMQKTQLLMHPIKIQVHAFTPLKLDFQLAGHSIAAQKPGATRFYATQNSDQPLAHLVALLDLAGHFLLARTAQREINHRTVLPPGQLLRRLTNTTGQVRCESLKILPQHSGLPKVLFHHCLIIPAAQRHLQPKTIPAWQHSNHIGLMPLHERAGYLVLCSPVGCSHADPLHQLTDSVISVAALPRWVLRGECLPYYLRL